MTRQWARPETRGAQDNGRRLIKAVHGAREIAADGEFEIDMATHLKERLDRDRLLEAFGRYVAAGGGPIDLMMRRVCLMTLVKTLGSGLTIKNNVSVVHPEPLEIGDGVFIGEQTIIQGRYDGRRVIGKGTWIGPHSFLDARHLVVEEYVGWGPGAKVLGSEHTGIPVGVPVILTDLEVAPVRICAWADIGMNASILPGDTVGRGALVGAGAVVTRDVPEFATAAGVSARVIAERDDREAGTA